MAPGDCAKMGLMSRLAGGGWGRSTLLAVLLILVATLLAYSGSLFNGFLVDDANIILNNHILYRTASISELLRTPFLTGYYRPLVLISFYLDHRVWGLCAVGFHLTNIILHFFNAVLVFLLLHRLFRDRAPALVAGLLFAVHPIQTIPVNNLSDRGNLFLVFFSLLSLLSLARTRDDKRSLFFFALSFVFFLAALLSRENAVFLPLTFWLWLFMEKRPLRRKGAVFLCACVITSLLYLAVRSRFFPFFSPSRHIPLSWESVSAFSFVIVTYLRQLIWPSAILFIREVPRAAVGSWTYPALLAGITGLTVWGARRDRFILFAALWFLFWAAPLYAFMHFRPNAGLMMQDNQLYLGFLGPIALLAWAAFRLRQAVSKKIWGLFLTAILIAYAAHAQALSLPYRDTKSFLLDWQRHDPDSRIVALNLAGLYFEEGKNDKALDLYKQSLTGYPPHDVIAYINMASLHARRNEYAQAKARLEQAKTLSPGMWKIYIHLAFLSEMEGDLPAAEAWFAVAARKAPLSPDPPHFFMDYLKRCKRFSEAETIGLDLFQRFPQFYPIAHSLIDLYLEQDDSGKALTTARRFIDGNKNKAVLALPLADLFHERGYATQAHALIEHAGADETQPKGRPRNVGSP